MKVSDRTRFIISAIAVGISILGVIASLIIWGVGIKKRSPEWGALGFIIYWASFFLFEYSGVAKDRLMDRHQLMSKRKKALGLAIILLPIVILTAAVLPFFLFLWALGSMIVGLVIGLVIVKKMGYL